MPDQATLLRGLMERHAQSAPAVTARRAGTRCLAIASGRRDVGKTLLALNMAVQLSVCGRSVCLIDANPEPGQLEALCGLNCHWNLKHVAAGQRSVQDIVLEGPAGIHLLTGAAELLGSPFLSGTAVRQRAWHEVSTYLNQHQHVVIDSASGESNLTRRIMRLADCTWLIVTPELTAISDTYNLIKSSGCSRQPLELIVNRATSTVQANDIVERLQTTTRAFLHTELQFAGSIPQDARASQSVQKQIPIVLGDPQGAVSQAIERLARHWLQSATANTPSLTTRLNHQPRRAA